MKRIFTIIVFVVATFILSSSSCGYSIDGVKIGDEMLYNIGFVFQDAEGNNLAEGIDLEDWIPANLPKEQATSGQVASYYKLDIILSKQSDKFDNTTYKYIRNYAHTGPILNTDTDVNYPKLTYRKINGCVFIGNSFLLYTGLVEPQDKLTYQITCPYIFGDDEVHTITTYWKELGDKIQNTYFGECYKVEFDGQTITDIGHGSGDRIYQTNDVTLTIER